MKIEKVNDHQIRCTLTKEDLANRELKISELAYGTDKAKDLFRDMMQQASYEFGFEAEDIPLMIEAVPLNSDCIVLIVTKVDDPEELDTRFSKFAPSLHDQEEDSDDEEEEEEEEPETAAAIPAAPELFQKADIEQAASASAARKTPIASRVFSFSSMRDLTELAHVIGTHLYAPNAVYRDSAHSEYLLILEPGNLDRNGFAKICNAVSEFGDSRQMPANSLVYLREHCEPVLESQALQTLAHI